MVKIIVTASLAFLLFSVVTVQAQEYLESDSRQSEEENYPLHGGNVIAPDYAGEEYSEDETTKARKYSCTYRGKAYEFYNYKTLQAFRSNPQKYMFKIKEINMTAYSYGFSPSTITVNKDDIVRIHAVSRDVPHGVFIRGYERNARVEKDKPAVLEFLADRTGEFPIVCSVYCGPGHHSMRAKLIVR